MSAALNSVVFSRAYRLLAEELEMCLITYKEYSERADKLARIEAATIERHQVKRLKS